jgi:EAL domain-containing protein (putative c-di-GMP-specific phosphodiesterase class I)/GGDEF domain-containing protein
MWKSVQRRFYSLRVGSSRTQILALACTATCLPLFVLLTSFNVVTPQGWLIAFAPLFALVLAIGCLLLLARFLRPLTTLAQRLDACASRDVPLFEDLPAIDNFDRISRNIENIVLKVDSLSKRVERHPITGLPVREDFVATVAQDLTKTPQSTLLGLIRFANLQTMLAFDTSVGERALVTFSRNLQNAVGRSRPIGHVDRDCFAIWFRNAPSHEEAAAELRAIGYVLSQEITVNSFTVTPDIQAGAALYPLDSGDAANLLSRAFVSLARPERTAEGGIAFFAPASPNDARRRFSLEQHLRHAIQKDQLSLNYQPFVDVARGRVVGAEALVRWRHPELGPIPPSEFVPILEETGLVHEFGQWTLNTACRQLRLWNEGGLGGLKLAINLSASQLRDAGLPSAIERTLAFNGIAPSQIELELTESLAMADADRSIQVFREFRDLGLGLAIDDFGSGYSSLTYLKKLPFTKLKIDRDFVTSIDQRDDNRAICRALVELAKGLELELLAEGVERLEEIEILSGLGCSTFQGYFFAKPKPAAEFFKTVTNADWIAMLSSPVHRERAELMRRLT